MACRSRRFGGCAESRLPLVAWEGQPPLTMHGDLRLKFASCVLLVALLLSAARDLAATPAGNAAGSPDQAPGASTFHPLFNGVDLDGWDGDPSLWRVEHGAIVGSSDARPLTRNSFLISKSAYRDFELRFEVKLRNGNSGMQFRSERTEDWTVRGYQADLASGKGWGNLHGEGLPRGLILDGWQDKAEFLVGAGWNEIAILCQGPRIRISLNGTVVNDVLDPGPAEGVLAMQLHRGEAMRVEFRNIRIRELPAE